MHAPSQNSMMAIPLEPVVVVAHSSMVDLSSIELFTASHGFLFNRLFQVTSWRA